MSTSTPTSQPMSRAICRHSDGTPMLDLAEVVRHRARVTPDLDAVEEGDSVTTYAELDRRSSRVAAAMRDSGIRAGDRVVLICANSTTALESVFGAAKIGAIATPVNAMLSPPEITGVLIDAEPALVLVDTGSAHLLAELADSLPDRPVLTFGSAEHDAWLAAADETDPGVTAGPDETCLLLYTSGTTGRPKGIEISCRNLADGLAMLHLDVGLETTSRCAGPAPFFHIGGIGLALVALLNGSCQLLGASLDLQHLHRSLVDGRVTHASLVPTLVARLLDVPEADAAQWAELSYVIYGGSPMPLSVLQRAQETLGCAFIQFYGMTEAVGGFCLLAPSDHVQRPGESEESFVHRLRSVGRPYVEGAVRVLDPDTHEDVPPGGHGEVALTGDRVMRGYWRQPELTAEAMLPGGWLRTGDGGSFDEDGYLHLHDRIKDMIVSGGENIYSIEVESVITTHPDVAEAAVVAVPSAKWGESPWAVVIRQPGATVSEDEVVDWARARLAHFKCPVGVTFVEDFPRTPLGKVKKAVLRATVQA